MSDAASIIVLCAAFISWRALRPSKISILAEILSASGLLTCVVAIRVMTDADFGLLIAAAVMLVVVSLLLGHSLLLRKTWPKRTLTAALAVTAAAGAFWRADLFEFAAMDPLQPDAQYYLSQAMETGNPFAAGYKSPLWSALHAPLVRRADDPARAMRMPSWLFGVAMVPLAGLAVARLFDPVAGVLVAGILAIDPYSISLCCEGLREELGLCLWMLIFLVLFASTGLWWRRPVMAGLLAGVLLLLRNIEVVPLMGMVLWAGLSQRWGWRRLMLALVLPVVIVMPFYINQYRAFGTPFFIEKRDARYHANVEFRESPPPGLTVPSAQEMEMDLFAGEPLSPWRYLVSLRSFGAFVQGQVRGLWHVVSGRPFFNQADPWQALVCAAGLVAALLTRRTAFAPLFVVLSMAGIRAHLMSRHQLEVRLLLPVMTVWLSCGVWLGVLGVRAAWRSRLAAIVHGEGTSRLNKPSSEGATAQG